MHEEHLLPVRVMNDGPTKGAFQNILGPLMDCISCHNAASIITLASHMKLHVLVQPPHGIVQTSKTKCYVN